MTAHGLKGMAANISAGALRNICLQIEEAAARGNVAAAGELLSGFKEAMSRTLEAVRIYLGGEE
jgi:HPt (histidine-containing phosphotransfer) domain-containing protein